MNHPGGAEQAHSTALQAHRKLISMSPAKTIGRLLGMFWMLPHLLLYLLALAVLGRQRAFASASERIARIPGLLGVYTRYAFYRLTLHHVGQDVYFGFMSVLSKPAASIGDRVYIGRFCSLGWVELGADVMLADGVQVLSGRHQHGSAMPPGPTEKIRRDQPQQFSLVKVGRGSWLGAGAVVMADIGAHAVVAAGAVVVKPVEDHATVAGVPAKVLRENQP